MATFSVQPQPPYNCPLSGEKWAAAARRSLPPSSFAPPLRAAVSVPVSTPKPSDDPTTSSSDGDKANDALEFRREAEGSPENQRPAYAAEKPETRTTAWNLRPRKRNSATDSAVLLESTRPEVSRDTSNRAADRRNTKKKKQRFSISLTKSEIEEDIFAMTGSTRPRQPKKKRSRAAKIHLDQLFPGQELHLITPKRYTVRDGRY